MAAARGRLWGVSRLQNIEEKIGMTREAGQDWALPTAAWRTLQCENQGAQKPLEAARL
jgi:hypothetical protein